MKKIIMSLVLVVGAFCVSEAYAQPPTPAVSQSQVNVVKECMRRNGVVLQEPPKGGALVMTDAQRAIMIACSKPVAEDIALDAAKK